LGLATPQQAARIPMTIVPAERARADAMRRRTLASLQAVDARRLSDNDRVAVEVLRHHAGDALAAGRFPEHLLPLNHMPGSSPLFMLATAADSGLSRFASTDDHQHHLQRLQALPAWCEQ